MGSRIDISIRADPDAGASFGKWPIEFDFAPERVVLRLAIGVELTDIAPVPRGNIAIHRDIVS